LISSEQIEINRHEIYSNLDVVKKKLKEIFIYYASFGDRMNHTNLKSNKFMKMMQDSNISKINKRKIDLIFVKINKN
jgi:DNA anti-recombination protein RmuC